MRIVVNFMLRDVWFVHCDADDARTPISPILRVRDQNILIRVLRYVGATDADVVTIDHDIRHWSHGSVWIDLTPGRKNLLRIRSPWCADLV